MASRAASKPALAPESQLRELLAAYEPGPQKLFRAARKVLRARFPTALEIAYAYEDSVVIAYSPTEHGIDGVVSIAARADGVRLYFNNGPKLKDPERLLQGSGRATRFIVVESARRLAAADVQAWLDGASRLARVPMPRTSKGGLVIKETAASRRKAK